MSGGPAAAVLFTILAGAKRHRIEPWTYLRDLLLRLHAMTIVSTRCCLTAGPHHPEAVLTYRLEESRNKAARKREQRRHRRARLTHRSPIDTSRMTMGGPGAGTERVTLLNNPPV